MKTKPTFAAFSILALLSLTLLLAACGTDSASGTTGSASGTDSAARQQFLADRSGTPDPNATPLPGANNAGGGFGGRQPGLFGVVQKVDGNSITITTTQTSTETLIQVSDTTTISKEATAQASDLKVGDAVTAIGAKNGDSVTAQRVQIGEGFGGFGGFGGGGFNGAGRNGNSTGAFPSRTPPSGFNGQGRGRFQGNGSGTPGPSASRTPGAGGNFAGDFVSGTIEKIDGDTVTVKAQDGTSSTFLLTTTTTIMKQEALKAADLVKGNTIIVTGKQNGTAYDATTIQVVDGLNRPQPQQQTPTP